MSHAAYIWRKLTQKQRGELISWRKHQGLPWHRPPHRAGDKTRYHLIAACYEHRHHIGASAQRMQQFSVTLTGVFKRRDAFVHAWCVLPNHYHALIETTEILALLADLGKMHGRLSHEWNGQDQTRGRQVWCGVAERYMRNERHFWATINYVHNNPVHHGYVRRWQEWPFSSAEEYLAQMGHEEAVRIWNEYPTLGYGKGWDDPSL